jgi:hypothetical protein
MVFTGKPGKDLRKLEKSASITDLPHTPKKENQE